MKRGFSVACAVTGVLVAMSPAAVAAASTSDPTVGDTIVYEFYSDVSDNESTTWFDANGEIAQFTSTHLPSRAASGAYVGTQRVLSRSTYQPVGSSIQTDGYFAGCRIRVNGVVTASNHATGRYAVASCG